MIDVYYLLEVAIQRCTLAFGFGNAYFFLYDIKGYQFGSSLAVIYLWILHALSSPLNFNRITQSTST